MIRRPASGLRDWHRTHCVGKGVVRISTCWKVICEVVARSVHHLGEGLPEVAGYSPVGAVVGATSKADIEVLRGLMPRAWLLLPGVGAQGATAADCAAAFDDDGLGGLINQSRGVMQGFEPDDPNWLDAIEAAVSAFSQQAREVARGGARSRTP